MTKPWEELRFLKKIEIVAAAPDRSLRGVKVNTSYNTDLLNSSVVLAQQVYSEDYATEISVPYGCEVVYTYDYPDKFKKLVDFFADYVQAWELWEYLESTEKAPEHWNAIALEEMDW